MVEVVSLVTALLFGFTVVLLWKIVQVLIEYKHVLDVTKHIPKLKYHHPVWGDFAMMKDMSDYHKWLMEDMQKTGAKWHVLWVLFLYPVYIMEHPDTIKAILKSSTSKTKGVGGAYTIVEPWLGMNNITFIIHIDVRIERNCKFYCSRYRRLLTPAFHFDILRPYITEYNQVADILLNKLASACKTGQSIEICGHVTLATLDTLLRCALSYEGNVQDKGDDHPYVSAVKMLTILVIERFLNPFVYPDFVYYRTKSGKKFLELCDYVHEFAMKIIGSRRQALAKNPDQVKKRRLDFLDILLIARDENEQGLTDEEIRQEVDTFMFAGHDTTSSAIYWGIYALGKYPAVQEKVYEEITAIMGEKASLDWEDLQHLRYLNLVIKENMRMFSTVPAVSRQLDVPTVVEGVELPAGSRIDINMNIVNHRPDIWQDPMEYRPERFEEANSQDPYSYIPFSMGSRNCIGKNFALNEQRVILARFVQRFKIKVDPSHKVERFPELIMKAKTGIKVFLEERTKLS
ncbi:hypothetical protein ACJMK2_009145 [Sinanodonta woodiana]|uniref:Cytochrome P450 n=1 Tax=Sinanodonta woodiana TaxID=1069815 RepID=A0ABD3VCJ4_SINWO